MASLANCPRCGAPTRKKTRPVIGRVTTEAERMEARYNLLTTGQVAERLSSKDVSGRKNVTSDTVRAWCAAGWIDCVDGRKPGAKRAYYLLDWSWVEAFIQRGGAPKVAKDATGP